MAPGRRPVLSSTAALAVRKSCTLRLQQKPWGHSQTTRSPPEAPQPQLQLQLQLQLQPLADSFVM